MLCSVQGKQLLPVALPANPKALAIIADGIGNYNRDLYANLPESSANSITSAEDLPFSCGNAEAVIGEQLARLTPWLATSLAPIGAAVAIQAHWRGWVSRQRVGPLGPQLLHRRAAVCIQRAWRACELSTHCCLSLAL